jgi:hypothetical protein
MVCIVKIIIFFFFFFFFYPAEWGQIAKTPPGNLSWAQTRFNENALEVCFGLSLNNNNVPLSIKVFETLADMPDRNE